MDFTREPVIETVVTPKEGCKLVIRNSKGSGQEEYFVDAVEIITFGQAIFFRSLERPKPFIVPASDYEVLEVREARMVLKNVGLERSIKIGGGRENNMRAPKEVEEKADSQEPQANTADAGQRQDARPEMRNDRKRDRRRQSKRRREVVDQSMEADGSSPVDMGSNEERIELAPPQLHEGAEHAVPPNNGALLASLLAPPPLISETIGRYKEQFKDAFYTKEEQESKLTLDPDHIPLASEPMIEPDVSYPSIPLEQPAFGAFELSEDAEEEIYRQRKRKFLQEDDSIDSSVIPSESSADETSSQVQTRENPEE